MIGNLVDGIIKTVGVIVERGCISRKTGAAEGVVKRL